MSDTATTYRAAPDRLVGIGQHVTIPIARGPSVKYQVEPSTQKSHFGIWVLGAGERVHAIFSHTNPPAQKYRADSMLEFVSGGLSDPSRNLLSNQPQSEHRFDYAQPPSAAWTRELDQLREQAREPDWDGEGADPIDPSSLEFAHDLLSRFPHAAKARDDGRLVCELFASPDGDVIFYWYDRSEKATLTVFAKPGREVSYSASLPDENMRGEIRDIEGCADTLEMAFRKLLAVPSSE